MASDHMSYVQLLPYLLAFLPFAIGNWFLARAVGQPRILWVILSLVPILNLFFLYDVFYTVVLQVLRRLDEISRRLGGDPAAA
ncbi:MAG: hypothetical protein RIB84_26445 [Sneathiellaceae bacterium]